MSRLAVELLLGANRMFPAPALPGDADPMEYAAWEYRNSVSLAALWEPVRRRRPRRALDVGCGLGGKTRRLADSSPDTAWTALDLRVAHLRQAALYHQRVGPAGIPKVAADVIALPFAAGTFDAIVTSDTLEHFPEPRRALGELRRCLHPEGRLVLQFNPWGSPRGSHLGDLLRLPWCQSFASRETLVAAALTAGERRAGGAPAEEAKRIRDYSRTLVDHFRNDVFTVRIRDFRSWIREDGLFRIESEIRMRPGPLRHASFLGAARFEEWMTAAYGAVLAPL